MGDSEDERDERQIKIVVVGDGSAGKSSFIARFTQDKFGKQYRQTMGIDFFSKKLTLLGSGKSHDVILKVWDIGGQTLGGKMLDTYIAGSEAVIFLYDVTNAQSFEDITDWYQTVRRVSLSVNGDSLEMRSSNGDNQSPGVSNSAPEQTQTTRISRLPIMALVGNKMDLEHMRTVKLDRHDKFASEHGMSSHFVSARTGESVDTCFEQVACRVMGIKVDPGRIEQSKRVIIANIEKDRPPAAAAPAATASGIDKNAAAVSSQKKKSSICVLS